MAYYKVTKKKETPITVVTWADGTDAEIAAALTAHYNNEIDLTEYWAVGDERVIHLNSMQAPNPNSSNTWAAQDITVVIVAMNHTDLVTPINGHTKAAITVQTKECMNNINSDNRTTLGIYINGASAKITTFTKWSNLYMRTYLNDKVLAAIPSGDFKSAIKQSKHYRHTTYNGTTSEEVSDTLFLPSYPEVCGTTIDSYYVETSPTEGTQFPYYETTTNRIKYGNNNGVSNDTAVQWWESSPSSSSYDSLFGYMWRYVGSDGVNYRASGTTAYGLAPAWAM